MQEVCTRYSEASHPCAEGHRVSRLNIQGTLPISSHPCFMPGRLGLTLTSVLAPLGGHRVGH